jgi:ADP-heptose:LPS heptosyltransferase
VAERVLVVDLLGGLGDLVMVLPAVHALARRHGPVRVLTHGPGDALLASDPAVAAVRRAERGREREAVEAELDRGPDLVVSTTDHSGIGAAIRARAPRSVTNLWRRPPPDQPVGRRYLQILAEEGLVDGDYVPPALHLTAAERTTGARRIGARGVGPGAPVVLVPDAGMAVKVWPHWAELAAALAARGAPPLVVGEGRADGWRTRLARPLPPVDLRGLAAVFAAVGERGGVVVGPDTGPLRVAAAVGARTVGLFGPTLAARYGLDPPALDLQGLPGCPHRRPTAITEQVCWWDAACPLSSAGPACLADIPPSAVLEAVDRARAGVAHADV